MLDPSALPRQLEAFIGERWGAPVTVSDYQPITGGYSRYMARFVASDGSTSRTFILRADPPPGQSIIDTDRPTEWGVLNAVAGAGGVAVPSTAWFDERGDELGSPAIVLDYIEGDTLFAHLQRGDVSDHLSLTPKLADLIADIHAVDPAVLPDEVSRPTSWDGYIDSCIERWVAAEGAHVEADPFMRLAAAWLDANRPPETELRMVHGDMQPPNIVIEATTGEFHMLDWELARIGDPREDLGWWTLACKSQPPDLIEADTDAFYARYRERTGLSEDVINPETVAYFTVLSAAPVFISVINQTAVMAREETTAMSVGYMTNAIPFMHGVWLEAMQRAGKWRGAPT